MYYQIVINGLGYWPLVINDDGVNLLVKRLPNISYIQLSPYQLKNHMELANAGVGIPRGRDLRTVVDCTGVKLFFGGAIK